ncbi:MAG: 50S ribosomal protein L17 [Pseudobdellovibrionaceae bacterium]
MSSHRRRVKHFSRKSGPRKALLGGILSSLVEHGRITTTVDRAKEVRRHIEKAITLGKKGDLATRRLLLSRYPANEVGSTILDDLSVRFKTRPGGYTRVIKIGRRPGDTAEMAFLEFVDYDFEAKATDKVGKTTEVNDEEKGSKKLLAKSKKLAAKTVADKKKAVRKIQKKNRSEARA